MSKSKNRSYAEVKAQKVMDQVRVEIPEFNLPCRLDRLITIRDGLHETTITQQAFIVMRYADVIEELIESIVGLLAAGDDLVRRIRILRILAEGD